MQRFKPALLTISYSQRFEGSSPFLPEQLSDRIRPKRFIHLDQR